MASKPAAPKTVVQPEGHTEPEDLTVLRREAERYPWLRERAIRIRGSDIWWQGEYLDLRCDTGLGHIEGEYQVIPETAPNSGRLDKDTPTLK
jgi:hypothetical protein